MIKPLTRPDTTSASSHPDDAFADTPFFHAGEDEDDPGFPPTRMFSEEDEVMAAGSSGARSSPGSGWATSRWDAGQEVLAHEAADEAHAVIAAQRRAADPGEAPQATVRGGLNLLRSALARLLPLFIGVAVTMALISALLPLFDKP